MGFFAFGVYFKEYSHLLESKSGVWALLLGVMFVAGQYVFYFLLGLNSSDGGVFCLAIAFISILFVVSLSMYLGKYNYNWFAFVGASSMVIYLMHVLAGSGMRIVLSKFFGVESAAMHLLLGTLIGLFAPIFVAHVIERYGGRFLLVPPKIISASKFVLRNKAAVY